MKKNMVFIGILALVLGGSTAEANWSGDVRVTAIEVSHVNLEGVWVRFTPSPFAGPTCSVDNGFYMLGGGQATVDKLTAIATSALVNSRAVSVFWDGACSGFGTSGYPVVRGLTLK
jgi:hypothetical protein